jgi:Ca2+-binding RTX toxin-like protein
LATAVAVVLTPAAAHAASVYGSGASFDYGAQPGERNDVTVSPGLVGGFFVVRDAGAPLTAVGQCASLDAHTARCLGSGPWNVVLDDLDDRVRFLHGTEQATIDGGDGDDTLAAPDGGTTIWGGAGDDTVTGGAGPDTVYGGGGDDRVAPGLGQDRVTLGLGSSAVDVRDGQADSVACTDGGTATVLTDPLDTVDAC